MQEWLVELFLMSVCCPGCVASLLSLFLPLLPQTKLHLILQRRGTVLDLCSCAGISPHCCPLSGLSRRRDRSGLPGPFLSVCWQLWQWNWQARSQGSTGNALFACDGAWKHGLQLLSFPQSKKKKKKKWLDFKKLNMFLCSFVIWIEFTKIE